MMDAHNQLFRLRVGTDGRISLSRNLAIPSTINLSTIASVPKRVLEAGMEAGDKMQGRVTRRWRKAVTGDPNKRIRDHMREIPQVKMIDKISFTFGVLCICGSEWLSLRHADWFPLYYFTIMTLLLLWRLITYTKDKYQLFMLGQSQPSHCYISLSFFRLLLLCEPVSRPADFLLQVRCQLVQSESDQHSSRYIAELSGKLHPLHGTSDVRHHSLEEQPCVPQP